MKIMSSIFEILKKIEENCFTMVRLPDEAGGFGCFFQPFKKEKHQGRFSLFSWNICAERGDINPQYDLSWPDNGLWLIELLLHKYCG